MDTAATASLVPVAAAMTGVNALPMPKPATEATAPPNIPAHNTRSSNMQGDPSEGRITGGLANQRPGGEDKNGHARCTSNCNDRVADQRDP
jgi:hypothetical protein